MEQHDETGRWVDGRLTALNAPGEWSPDEILGWAYLGARRQAIQAHRRRLAVALGGVAMAGGLVAAFPVSRALASRCIGACVARSSQVSQFVWNKVNGPHSSATPAPARPVAPDFTLTDAAGRPVRLSDFRGRIVLLNFWATWCPPCKVEVPWFDEFQQQYGGRGLTVLGVSVDEDGWNSVSPFVASQKIGYRILAEGGAVAKLFGGVETLPATLTIDRQGRIAAVHTGLIGKEAYRVSIEAMLAE